MQFYYTLKVHAGRQLHLSARTAVQMLLRQTKKYSFFTVKKFTEQKFQVQRNGETGHFSDSVPNGVKVTEKSCFSFTLERGAKKAEVKNAFFI